MGYRRAKMAHGADQATREAAEAADLGPRECDVDEGPDPLWKQALRQVVGLAFNGAQFYRDTGSTLYMAAESGVRTVFDALIADARIAVNVTNLEEDTTALMTAVEHNHTYIVQKLLTHQDIDKEQADSDGQTAVFRLAYMPISDAEDMLDVLVDRGVNINAVDNDNETVLMVLAQECKWSLVELAIERGARVNIKSKAGMTAYDYALTKCTDDLTEDVKRALDPA